MKNRDEEVTTFLRAILWEGSYLRGNVRRDSVGGLHVAPMTVDRNLIRIRAIDDRGRTDRELTLLREELPDDTWQAAVLWWIAEVDLSNKVAPGERLYRWSPEAIVYGVRFNLLSHDWVRRHAPWALELKPN